MGIFDKIRDLRGREDDNEEEEEDGAGSVGGDEDDAGDEDEVGGPLGNLLGLLGATAAGLPILGKVLKKGQDEDDEDDEEDESDAPSPVAARPAPPAEPEPETGSEPDSVTAGNGGEPSLADLFQEPSAPAATDPTQVDLTGGDTGSKEQDDVGMPGVIEPSLEPELIVDEKGEGDNDLDFSLGDLFEKKMEINQGLRDLAGSQEDLPAHQLSEELQAFLRELETY